jgi:ABC-type multidrug transport system ATPase subunit/ABC-type multidrug transport system permease subunit
MVKMTMVSTNTIEGNKTVMTDEDQSQQAAAIKGVLLQANGLTVETRAGENLLSDVSFHIEPGELIALTGVNRSGKSILLQSLAGLMKPTSGEILIDGVNFYANLQAFRSSIGFVPSEFSLPPNLTVAEIMEEEARLRLPRRTPHQDRKQRVLTLTETMGLTQAADRRASLLNAAEKRKLSMAVELIGYPGLLLLDQSTEPLTPFEEVEITILLRQLSRQGLTIIQVDPRARSAGLSDKIIFLGPGGLVAWFGPADEAFAHLRRLVPRGVVKDLFGLKEALELLGTPQVRDGIEWAKRFTEHEAYPKYVDDPLHNRYPDLLLQTRPLLRLRLRNSSQEKLPPPIVPRANAIQKLMLLIRRNSRLLWREKTMNSILVIPPLIALIDLVLSSILRSQPERAPIIFGVLVFLVLLTSASLVQNEISKEKLVYRYENRTRTLLVPYVLSKVWLIGFLAIYQALVWTIIHLIATGAATGVQVLLSYGITIFLIALTGGMLGLIVSALSKPIRTTANWLLLLTVPQLIFSGAIIPVGDLRFPLNLLSAINPSRYALEALLTSGGFGSVLNTTPLGHWFVLAILSLCLIFLLMGIQRGAGSLRI